MCKNCEKHRQTATVLESKTVIEKPFDPASQKLIEVDIDGVKKTVTIQHWLQNILKTNGRGGT